MCEFCEKADFGNYGIKIYEDGVNLGIAVGSYRFPKDEQFKFCPECGAPLTEPKALTLDELRERDGKPTYIRLGSGEQFWAIVAHDDGCMFFYSPDWDGSELDADFYNMEYNLDPDGHFGLHILGWIAYDHPPKEAQK